MRATKITKFGVRSEILFDAFPIHGMELYDPWILGPLCDSENPKANRRRPDYSSNRCRLNILLDDVLGWGSGDLAFSSPFPSCIAVLTYVFEDSVRNLHTDCPNTSENVM